LGLFIFHQFLLYHSIHWLSFQFLFSRFLKNDGILHKTLRKIVIGNDEKSFKNRKSVRDKWSKTQESQH